MSFKYNKKTILSCKDGFLANQIKLTAMKKLSGNLGQDWCYYRKEGIQYF